MSPELPRMLLVDDDPVFRRFVRMALEDLSLDLIDCDGVAEALLILASNPVQMIVTDLMMPGESGFSLLQRIQDSPALRGTARVVVLSAGITPSKREQLASMNVWSILDKPVSVAQLRGCIEGGLLQTTSKELATTPSRPRPEGGARSDAQKAIDQYFAGDAELFRGYRRSCLAQFPDDVTAGDSACSNSDLQALRRVAHNLKSVLQLLGYPTWSALALAIEQHCESGQSDSVFTKWRDLRSALLRLPQPSP